MFECGDCVRPSEKGVKCSIVGCEKESVRSLSPERVAGADLNIGDVRRVYLCEEHYKVYKKKKK
ncbi:MAG: hypothetical protein QXL67_03715, partial [Candidatus Bathyarchaeia archaeon]